MQYIITFNYKNKSNQHYDCINKLMTKSIKFLTNENRRRVKK